MTGVILQARLGSTRLPRKALLPLAGEPMIVRVMQALALISAETWILATDEASREAFVPLARSCSFTPFCGDATDLLDRYLRAAERHGITRIVRATGDNPLVSATSANLLLEDHTRARADFSAYDGLPLGAGVEIVETQALAVAAAADPTPYEREHATPFIYHRPEQFVIQRRPAPPEHRFPEARVTVDTDADYRHVKAVFEALHTGAPVELEALITHLRAAESSAGR